MLNLQERGFWLQCLMLMHEADERGKLTVNGRPMPMDGLAMIMGIRTKEVEKIVEKLVAHGVASMDETGVLYSRRMVRDEGLRKVRAEGGKLGGNPALMDKRKVRGKVNLPDNLAPTPSSSSSISSSDIPPYPQGGGEELKTSEAFNAFWKAYPRKQAKGDAIKAWKNGKCERQAPAIMAGVERAKKSVQWTKDNGQFIPHPGVWLRKLGWHDEEPELLNITSMPPRIASADDYEAAYASEA